MCQGPSRQSSTSNGSTRPAPKRMRTMSGSGESSVRTTWDDLNIDVVILICSFLKPKDLLSFARVNSTCNAITSEPRLWWLVAKKQLSYSIVSRKAARELDWRALTLIMSTRNVDSALKFRLETLFPSCVERAEFARLTDIGFRLRECGYYIRAEKVFKRSLEFANEQFGQYSEEAGDATHNLSLAKGNQGLNNGADGSKTLREKAIEIYKMCFNNKPHAKIAAAIYSLADVYYVESKYNEAEPLYWDALRIREQCCPEDSELMSESYSGLGLIHDAKKQWDKAEMFYKKALAIREKLYGKDHPKVARVLVNLGAMWKAKGDLTKTIPLYERALQIRTKHLGADHPYTKRIQAILHDTKLKAGLVRRETNTSTFSLNSQSSISLNGSLSNLSTASSVPMLAIATGDLTLSADSGAISVR
eukprot:Colp12_sorted_trinity150504_noHs@20042